MTAHHRPGLPLRPLLAALAFGPPIAIFAAIPWLKQQPDSVAFLLSGIAATLTIVASFALGILHDRRLDEWHRSAARFSSQWGWVTGSSLVALLLALPPARDLIVASVAALKKGPPPDHELVVLTFTFGFMAAVLAQLVCVVLLSLGWSYWMSRGAREPG